MRILIVEDDAQLGDALSCGLRQLGHAVDWFGCGSAADSAMNAAPYDVVVLDLGLPGGDGMVWLKDWRARDVDSPIVVLTARDAVEQRIAGLDAGADDYLVKPITIDELAARLRALMRRTAGKAQSVWQHGPLEYDPASRVVRWKGEDIELTRLELSVLEALLSQPQRVLSKAYLREKLYDWADTPESNSLEVHIHHLRRKIDPGIVRTVRGVGYALGPVEASA